MKSFPISSRLKKSIFFAFILLLSLSFHSQAATLPNFSDLIKNNSPAVVKINTIQKTRSRNQNYQGQLEELPPFFREFFERQVPRNRSPEQGREQGGEQSRPLGSGSGFIIESDGYVLTNNHVIEDADEIIVRLNDRSEFVAEIVGTDPRSDLALLKIDAKKLPTVTFAKQDNIDVGSWVVAIGSPFGLDYSASAGIVSAIGRSLPNGSDGSNYVPFIQTDVAINPGNSGGPLFNMAGEVVGVNSQIYTRSGGSMGLSFAIPTSVVNNVIAQIKENGFVKRGYLGVVIQEVDKELAKSFGLDKPTGSLINQVIADSPAEDAGIKAGDIILEIDGKKIEYSHDLPHNVGLIAPGKKIKARLMRRGKEKEITITVGSLEGDNNVATSNSGDNLQNKLGIEVTDISTRDMRRLRLRGGAEVQQVRPDSSAANIGIRAGDIIVQFGFEDVLSQEQFNEQLSEIEAGSIVPIRFFRNNRAFYFTIEVN